MIPSKRHPWIVVLGVIAIVALIAKTWSPSRASDYSARIFTSGAPNRALADVWNGTLGFQKVFAVGLPERTDKRDALTLTSSLVGFKIDWVNGVKGESIPDKAVPFGTDRVKLWENNLGSWRGHMNAVRGYAYFFL